MRQANLRQLIRWTWHVSRGVRARVIVISLLGLVRVAASLTFVWVSKVLIDTATASTSTDRQIWTLAFILAGCMLVELALSQAASYMTALTNQRMSNNLRHDIYDRLLHNDLYDDRRHTGDLLNRLTLDVNKIVETVTGTIPLVIVMSVQLLGAFWLLCMMSPALALCALIITPLGKLISKLYIKRMRRLNAQIRDGESRIHANVQEGLQHRIVVQTLECAPLLTQRLRGLQGDLYGMTVSRSRVSLFSRSVMRIGLISGYLIAFIWSVFCLHQGTITFGIMTAFLQLVGRIQGPISSLSSKLPGLLESATAIDRLIEITDTRAPESPVSDKLDTHGEWGINVSDVSFAYDDEAKPVFSHFSCSFPKGSKTVIMGPTGVGKSTLTKLILALLHPDAGTIEFTDGRQRVLAGKATRRLITYVPQGNSLLEGTIRENLLLGNQHATEQQMRAALNTAVANFVFDLPQGLDTPCGELGSGLSEGQCQRIAIARALLRQAPILIFDEFNSSLDQATASLLMDRLITEYKGCTFLFISHRPEVQGYCDSVLRLE